MAKSKWPLDQEIVRQLPRWAAVALAARCARRVQPLFVKGWPDAPQEHREAVLKAVLIAEQSARMGHSDPVRAKAAVTNALHAGMGAAPASGRGATGAKRAASWAARSASDATLSVAQIGGAAAYAGFASKDAATAAAAYAGFAANAEGTAVTSPETTTADIIDLEELLRLASVNGWTDDSPVDVDRIGPLWWGQEPDWWPEEPLTLSDNPPVMRLEFSIPEGIPRAEADRLIGEILQRANELHHSMGGTGLTITDAEVYEAEPALVPAGGDDDDGKGLE